MKLSTPLALFFVPFLIGSFVAAAEVQEGSGQSRTQTAQSGQEEEQEQDIGYHEVVVVTAARTEQPLIEAISLVSAFDAEELQISPAFVIDEQLRRVPGFSLFRRSSSLVGHPTTQGVSLRGIGPSGTSRSLVLWDGIPLNDPFGNWVYWNRVPTLSMRSVEVSRGATSQLYGSSALGGTIQLMPRRPVEDTFEARAQLGTLETYDLDVFASDRREEWAWLASGRAFDTEGYIKTREEERGAVDVPTNASFQSFVGRLEYRDFHVGVNLFGEDRSNGTPIQRNDTQIYLFESGYAGPNWNVSFYGQSTRFDSVFSRILPGRNEEIRTAVQEFPTTGFGSSFTMRTERGLSWGADWRRASWDVNSQNFAGGFLQYLYTPEPRFDVLVGGRVDVWENREVQTSFNPRAGIVFRASDRMTLRTSGYRGFRAPSLNELYRPFRVGNVITQANPDLKEETVWGLEGGVDLHPSRKLLVRLNAFYNSLDDPVANVTLEVRGNEILRQRQNLGGATIRGLEAESRYRLDDQWSFRGAYLFSDATDDQSFRLPQVARQQGTLGLVYEGPFLVTADLRMIGEAFDDDLNQLSLAAYQIVDLSLRVPVSETVDAYFALENLFDEAYVVGRTPEDTLGTPRIAHGGVHFRLGR